MDYASTDQCHILKEGISNLQVETRPYVHWWV